MSLLNQLFNRGVFGGKCKTCLNLAISRIKLLQNRRDLQMKLMRKEIAQFLQAGQEAIARIRVEHVMREQNIWAAYEILELFCEFVLARVPIIESQKECPTELREAIASIIFAAPRCSDLPDLLQLKNLFTTKYGKEFVAAISELRPDSGVNRTIIGKLSVSAPSPEAKLKVLKEIAQEYKIDWDSSTSEKEFRKTHEDLLGGPKDARATPLPQATDRQESLRSSTSNGSNAVALVDNKQQLDHQRGSNAVNKTASSHATEIQPVPKDHNVRPENDVKTVSAAQSSDVLERARAAIASAERASAAARAAAELAKLNLGPQKLGG